MRRHPAWIGVALLVVALGRTAPAEEEAVEVDGLAAAVAFFDGLELPEPAAHPWVTVWTGWWGQQGDGPRGQIPRHGLLLVDAGDTFQVLLPDLAVWSFEKTPPATEPHERVAFVESSLEAYVADRLARWKEEEGASYYERSIVNRFGPHLDPKSVAAVLAWMCAKRGLDEAARACWNAGAKMEEKEPYLADVKSEVRTADLWRIVEGFGDPSIPLATLLERLRRHVRVFAGREGLAHARSMEEALAAQLSHEAVREPAADAPVADRVAHLVHQLTTQHGRQGGQPGRCDVFNDEREEKSPAHRLVALGYDAVPALVDALDDLRFTRSIGFVRDFYFSHHALRVCDVALDVLATIAGQAFWHPPYFSEHVSQEDPDVRAQVATRVRAWWEQAEAKGELATLEAEIVLGGGNAPLLARRLLAKDGRRGFAALRRGLAAAADAETRGYLVQVLGDVESAEATALLGETLAGDEALLVRATAAYELLDRDPEAAITRMIHEWGTRGPVADGDGGRLCREFLQGCGDVRGVAALAASLDAAPPSRRVEVLTGLLWSGWSAPYSLRPPAKHQKLAPLVVLDAVEALLVGRLSDRDAHPVSIGLYSSLHDRFIEPRVCDYAAWVLAEFLPEAYAPFDPATGVRLRDRRIAELANVHRKRVGEPVVELFPLEEPPSAGGRERRVVEISRTGVEPDAWGDLGPAIDALEGKELTAAALIDVVLAAIARLDETTNAFRLHVHRDEPHLGIAVRARLERREAARANTGISHAVRIRVGTEDVGGHSGSGTVSYVSSREAWTDTEEALAAMLAAPPTAILDAKIDVSSWMDRK